MESEIEMKQKYIAHFSHGVPSTVAAHLAVREFGVDNVRVVTCDTGSEHEDNIRYRSEAEGYIGAKIEVIKSNDYSSVSDVIRKTRWIAGVGGARCTGELKRKPAENLINYGKKQEVEILGYTIEEACRVKVWQDNNRERKIDPILIRHQLSKVDCQGMIAAAGIKRPVMYDLGYRNNNCIGCVKGGAGYWNKIRIDFPEVFEERAAQEREIGAAICKVEAKSGDNGPQWPDWVYGLSNFGDETISEETGRARLALYLDEMPEDYGNYPNEIEVQCGLFCMIASTNS